MTYREWIVYYERHTKETFEPDPLMTLAFDPEKGFMEWGIDQKRNALIVGKTAGQGKFWERLAVRLARERGCPRILTFTRRNPAVYMRRFPEARIYGTWFEREVN